MSTADPKAMLRIEFSARIRDALALRQWTQLEHWAKQWIQLEPRAPSPFKWLARAALATNQLKRAAYAYGRLLDFDPANEEARKFFAEHPSSLSDQPASVSNKIAGQTVVGKSFVAQTAPGAGRTVARENAGGERAHLLNPAQRRQLAQSELELAETYRSMRLGAEASARYAKSFEWHPSKLAAIGYARTLREQQKGLEAIRFLRQQLYHYPDWVEGRLLLGRAMLDQGHRADAQREWQSVLEVEPRNAEAIDLLRVLLSR